MTHIQEEQHNWDKFIREQRSIGRRFIDDEIDKMTIELGIYGITTVWQCESLRMQDFWARVYIPHAFVDFDTEILEGKQA